MLDPENKGVDWIRIVAERLIDEAIAEGKFDNLPGKGQPLVFEDDLVGPPHLRAANHVLKNAGVVPTWLSIEQEIEQARAEAERFREDVMRAHERPGRAFTTAELSESRARYEKLMRKANDLILRYNVVTPFSGRAPIPFRIKERLEQWDAAINLSGGTQE